MNSPAPESEVAALVTKVSLAASSSAQEPLGNWLVKVMMAGCTSPGFVSGEIMPPNSENPEWSLVQRFQSPAQRSQWRSCEAHANLLRELKTSVSSDALTISQEDTAHAGTRGNVTTAIVTHVKPGMEDAYRGWESKIQELQANFPGYQGSYLQPPTGGASGMWVTLLRFDKPESLDNWFASPQRQKMVDEAAALVKSTDIKRITSSFPGWVPVDSSGNGPPNWKTFLLVLLGLYPIVTMEIRYLMPQLSFLPHAVANLIGNSISVALTTWLTMPLFIKWFGPWLFPPEDQSDGDKTKWIFIVIASFLAALAVMWNVV